MKLKVHTVKSHLIVQFYKFNGRTLVAISWGYSLVNGINVIFFFLLFFLSLEVTNIFYCDSQKFNRKAWPVQENVYQLRTIQIYLVLWKKTMYFWLIYYFLKWNITFSLS